ncbi:MULTISPECIES: hydroxymethylglutaryl-CoA synthase family protein [unclassified Novosphingobium]|uniref:hydroxymethylglutaryl-CoA synthase family protein n=1 Tax=unclassified Novosphingobium TaxID=2644732 RepID=UPI0013581D8A|nr:MULTISPECIES: 3-oxoacyl-[acyl-carrier-protein] synthase III C-terminal domain-containing protein [unclassified Novosphingobium]
MSDFGITAFGAYVPRMRLDREAIAAAHKWMAPSLRSLAKGARAFCNWDEDTATMAVEAARDALAGSDHASLQALGFATTRPPYADLQPSAIVAGALGLPRTIRTFDGALGQRAGTSGLLAALKAGEQALFVASDAPRGKPASTQEMTYGAGAAAFVLGSENVAARLVGTGNVAANFASHFRPDGADFEYHWEERWVRDEGYAKLVPPAVDAALAQAGLTIADIAHFAMPSPIRAIAAAAAKQLRFTGEMVDGLEDGCGYAGCAHALLMLARALETAQPGERILVVSFGQGVDALVFEVTDAIAAARPARGVAGSLARGIVTDAYLRMLSFQQGIELEWGMRAEKNAKTALTEQYRSGSQIDTFTAGECGSCGTIQFPQLQYCVNCHAPGSGFSDVPLVDAPAKVMTQTSDWLSYYPSPPLLGGFVQFDNGARLQMEMVDAGPEGLELGMPLEMVFRIKEQDRMRGYNRYFWKASPRLDENKD